MRSPVAGLPSHVSLAFLPPASVARRRTYAAVLWRVVVATAPLAGEDARFPGATSPAPSLDAAFVSMLDAGESSSLKHLESQMFWLLSTHPFTSAPRHHLNCYEKCWRPRESPDFDTMTICGYVK